MKQLPTALQNQLYNNEAHILADLYTFAFRDGTRRWTSYPTAITSGSTTWSVGPGFDRGTIDARSGLEVGSLEVKVYPDSTTISGMPMAKAARNGAFDSVRVTLQRAYMVTPGDASAGLVTEFDGYVTRAEPGSTEIKLTVQSLLGRLKLPVPSRVTMTNCPYQVYGAACGVNKATFTHSRTVASGSSAQVVVLSSGSTMAVPGGYVSFPSGSLVGVSRVVRSVSGSALTLVTPLPSTPTVGDAVNVIRGCDKTRATCSGTFNNLLNYGGFPDTPQSESTSL